MSLVVGLMSGTSLDGVDAIVADFSAARPQTLASVWQPYPEEIRTTALRLQSASHDEIHVAAVLGSDLARWYARAAAEAISRAGLTASSIAAIGCHGQTIRHRPSAGYSLQLNNPALLAELTGIAVVADFRSRDIAAGGQGAPLVPAYHAAVFGDPQRHRTILNVGGIANLTDLRPGRNALGFDCGPGNLLMDAWIERHTGHSYDEGGAWAGSGQVLPDLLARLRGHPFLVADPPKSCGREEFNLEWLGAQLTGDERPQDVQATLLELTANSAVDAMARWCGLPEEVYVCGGGARNLGLMSRLEQLLQNRRVASTDSLGQPADWVEAVAFAWLAWRTLRGESGNLPGVTGARGPRILGAIYPA